MENQLLDLLCDTLSQIIEDDSLGQFVAARTLPNQNVIEVAIKATPMAVTVTVNCGAQADVFAEYIPCAPGVAQPNR